MENISDIPDEEFLIKVKTIERNVDILISKEDDPTQFEPFLTLDYVDFSHNGMIKYSFEPKLLGGGEFGFDKDTFPEIVYHIIKSFYHIHEFHEDESDSSLKPYLSEVDVDIHKEDNPAIRHYLENHERTILNLLKNAKTLLREVVDKEKQSDRKVEIRDYESFPSMYIMALGYDAYISSLYKSAYNKECNIGTAERDLRRRAFNIENSIRYFRVLYVFFETKIRQANNLAILQKAEANLKNSEINLQQLQESIETAKDSLVLSSDTLQKTEQTLKTSQTNIEETRNAASSSTKWAIASIAISFIIGVGSLIYACVQSRDSARQLENVRQELITTLDSLNKRPPHP